jgi:hypothetical protein
MPGSWEPPPGAAETMALRDSTVVRRIGTTPSDSRPKEREGKK